MDLIQGWSHLQALKTVLRDHEGTGDPIVLRTLVQVVQSIGMPHGLFRQETRGSNISYPDRRVRFLNSLPFAIAPAMASALARIATGASILPSQSRQGLTRPTPAC